MVEGIDKYLDRELAASVEKRKAFWKPDFSSPEAYKRSVQPNRDRLKHLLGVVDPRVSPVVMEYVSSTVQPAKIAETPSYTAHTVRWPVLEGVDGEGLLLEPKDMVKVCVVALPDADWTPEMLAGLTPGLPAEAQFARRLAENGCRVLVPVLIDRKDTWSGNPALGRQTNQPHREFIYRMAYEMGRHILGYEIQKVLAAVSWFRSTDSKARIAVMGYGEGGALALFSGAIDDRIDTTVVSGYFGPREEVWQEPIYRNVWSQLREFGDADLAAWLYDSTSQGKDLARSRQLWIETTPSPRIEGPPPARSGRSGAAPGRLAPRPPEAGEKEFHRALKLIENKPIRPPIFVPNKPADRPLQLLNEGTLKELVGKPHAPGQPPTDHRKDFDPGPRQKRQVDQLVAFTQKLMRSSEQRRQETFWTKLDYSSLQKYEASCGSLRKQLGEVVLGKLPPLTEPMNPRTRPVYEEPKWKGYEVTLDLFPGVFAYGILLLPRDLQPGERRPVVVCQHGLEGRPTDVCNPRQRSRHYNSFGAQLAERGFIVYAPQNPYIGQDKFRVLQRKANPLGLSLFSFIIAQHERTLDWLSSLPNVDPGRIAFYGLSYGGKTAMRVPAMLPRYCLSICSGDFNEWIWKNVSVDFRGSYMFTGEYEMPEFNLGHTLSYAEMAALIAPRPFMVERGHDDSVGIDEWVAYEYAKVRRLYSRLRIPDRAEIEFFAGGHEIHGQGTFLFLQKHLKWPR
jgi:dienelactone hydrolase